MPPRTSQQIRLTEVLTAYVEELSAAQRHQQQGSPTVSTIQTESNESFKSFDYFCAEHEPGISIHKYMERLVTYMRCTPECFILAAAYLRRAVDFGVPLTTRSAHRLLLTACVVAAKNRDDHYYSMVYYAQVGGVTARDLNAMELRFLLDIIEFRAEISLQEYRATCADITRAISPNVGLPKCSSDASVCGMSSGLPSSEATPKEQWCTPTDDPSIGKLSISRGLQTISPCASPAAQLSLPAAAVLWIPECGLYW
jgi:hypothetical protein